MKRNKWQENGSKEPSSSKLWCKGQRWKTLRDKVHKPYDKLKSSCTSSNDSHKNAQDTTTIEHWSRTYLSTELSNSSPWLLFYLSLWHMAYIAIRVKWVIERSAEIGTSMFIFISLVLDIYRLFKMVFDCLWVAVDVFEVIVEYFVGSCRWLLVVSGGCNYGEWVTWSIHKL